MRAAFIAVLLSMPMPALADEVAARLDYERAPEASRCPDEVALREAVSARLGYPAFDRTPPTRIVSVRIARAGRELTARIEVRDLEGTVIGARELSSPSADCAELASSVALAISIALDPSRLFPEAPAPEVAAEPVPAAVCPPAPAPPECPHCAAPPPSDPIAPTATAGIALGVGLAPIASAVIVLGAELAWPSFSFGLEAIIDLGAGAEASPPPAVLRTQLTLGGVRGCFRGALSDRFALAACAVVLVGALRGSSENVARPESALAFAALAGLRALFDVRVVDHFFVRVRADAFALLTQITLAFEDAPVWTSLPAAGVFALELGMDFP